MLVNNGIRPIDVAISHSSHTEDGPTAQFSAKICEVCALNVLPFGNRSPSQVSGLDQIARNILCQCILNSIKLVVSNILTDDCFQVRFGNLNAHCDLISNNEVHRIAFQLLRQLKHSVYVCFWQNTLLEFCLSYHSIFDYGCKSTTIISFHQNFSKEIQCNVHKTYIALNWKGILFLCQSNFNFGRLFTMSTV